GTNERFDAMARLGNHTAWSGDGRNTRDNFWSKNGSNRGSVWWSAGWCMGTDRSDPKAQDNTQGTSRGAYASTGPILSDCCGITGCGCWGREVCGASCEEWYPLFQGHFLFGIILGDFFF